MTDKSEVTKTRNESPTADLETKLQTNCHISPSKTGTKLKRKTKSSRRRLNALMNNTSLHFSDTDSEGELSVPRNVSPSKNRSEKRMTDGPVIALTVDGEGETKIVDPDVLMGLTDGPVDRSRRSSYVENLTDVDEIYTSDVETEQSKEKRSGSLKISDNVYQGETDFEDISNDEEDVQPTIYVTPRSDFLDDFRGETITTKEGDGPFSVEIRNRMTTENPSDLEEIRINWDIHGADLPNTDEEEMEASDEEEIEGETSGEREFIEDLDVLAASQIVMTNLDKAENTLAPKDKDLDIDCIADSHTDVEDVE